MRIPTLVVAALLPLATARAQETIPVFDMGARVRVYAPVVARGSVTGTVMESTPLRIQVMTHDFYRYDRAAPTVTRIDMSMGRDRVRGAVKGVLVGAAIGLLLTVPLRVPEQKGYNGPQLYQTRDVAEKAAWILTIGGLVAGGLRGSERWVTVWNAAPAP